MTAWEGEGIVTAAMAINWQIKTRRAPRPSLFPPSLTPTHPLACFLVCTGNRVSNRNINLILKKRKKRERGGRGWKERIWSGVRLLTFQLGFERRGTLERWAGTAERDSGRIHPPHRRSFHFDFSISWIHSRRKCFIKRFVYFVLRSTSFNFLSNSFLFFFFLHVFGSTIKSEPSNRTFQRGNSRRSFETTRKK